MFKGFYNLTSGMLTQGKRLDIISNNMTNVPTAGFKADRFTSSTFQEVLWQRVGNTKKQYTPVGEQSFITAPSELVTDFTQGAPDQTGLWLDFMIQGDGFFAVENDGVIEYTRNGSFSMDDEGYLTLPGQGRVLDVDFEPIQIVTDKIKTDGYGGIYTDTGGFLGQLGVFAFDDNAALVKNAQALFQGNNPQPVTVPVFNGMVERSNVDLVQQMVDMISSERAYQAMAQVAGIYDKVMDKFANDIGRLQ